MQLAAALQGAKHFLHVFFFLGGKKLLAAQLTYLNSSIKLAYWSVCLTAPVPFDTSQISCWRQAMFQHFPEVVFTA